MKICAVICEFNPFHNGHKYLLERARALSGCDRLLCIMSGSFTQRGEICIADRLARARHAVFGGADCVIELPAVFAVAPAEIFARGAVKILSSVPEVTSVAFGCENQTLPFSASAAALLSESAEFRKALGDNLCEGESYIKSYTAAFEKCGGNGEILTKPNNVLGLEYAKAILRANSKIEILPIKRIGADFNDESLKDNYSSASAIRNGTDLEKIKNNVPPYVFEDLSDYRRTEEKFKELAAFSILKTNAENLRRIFGCNEGLENKILSFEGEKYDKIVTGCTSKRYSSSRIKRILCANLLGLYEDDCRKFLNEELYIKPLAVKENGADEILSALSKSKFPLITRGRDREKLTPAARECLSLDDKAANIRNFISKIIKER